MDKWLAYADTLIAAAVRREGERLEFARQARVAARDLMAERMVAALDRLAGSAPTFEQKMDAGQVPGTAGWLRDPDVSESDERQWTEAERRALAVGVTPMDLDRIGQRVLDPDVSKAAAREDDLTIRDMRTGAERTVAGPGPGGILALGKDEAVVWAERADRQRAGEKPVEVDDLAKERLRDQARRQGDEYATARAEQLVAALTTALLGYFPHRNPLYAVLDHDAVARGLLNHPYVRDALEPARAVVWAEPLGTIVSIYREAGGSNATLIVKITPGVTVGTDIMGKKVAVAK